MLRLVDSLVRDGHNLQHFCREALRHVRNLLVVRVGGPAAELAEAAGEERRKLEAAARRFSEEDLLRFFNVLLRADGELRWSPHPRLHLELALLKLVQAERLVPLEEALSGLSHSPGGAASRAGSRPAERDNPAGVARPATPPAPREAAPAPAATGTPESSLSADTIETIQKQVHARSKFLGSLVDQVARWDRQGEGLDLWFTPENRSLVEMLDRKQQMELGKVVSEVLGEPVRVYAKVGAVAAAPPPGSETPAEKKEKHPVVRALLDRFGGTVSTASDLPEPEE